MTQAVLVTKQDDWSQHAGLIAQTLLGDDLVWIAGHRGDPRPDALTQARPDLLVSFLSPWIVPRGVLAACPCPVNFHPGSSAYPGVGCYNFALYEGTASYGAVCHFMAPEVDRGDIVAQRQFRVAERDTVETLKHRAMVTMTAMFVDFLSRYLAGEPIVASGDRWQRRPFTRKELDALCVIAPDMDPTEIQRRVRATTYPGQPGPTVTLGGVEFAASVPERKPLA